MVYLTQQFIHWLITGVFTLDHDPLIDSSYIKDSLLVHVNLDSNFEIKKEGTVIYLQKK